MHCGVVYLKGFQAHEFQIVLIVLISLHAFSLIMLRVFLTSYFPHKQLSWVIQHILLIADNERKQHCVATWLGQLEINRGQRKYRHGQYIPTAYCD